MNAPNIWYVYLDGENKWLSSQGIGGSSRSDKITDACEFFSEVEAKRVAEECNGMALGWFQ